MPSIRAKFQCFTVEQSEYGETIQLYAVADGSEENKRWSEATPAGSLQMTISNPGAQGRFKPGKSYYLDISEAE